MKNSLELYRRPVATFIFAAVLLLSVGCMKSPEQKFADFMESGLAAVEEEDYASALIHFKNAARLDSNEAEPFYQIAVCHLNRGQPQEAVDAVQQAVRINPDHVEANLLMARFMVTSKRQELLPRAEELLNGLLGQDRGNSDALFVLAATRAQQGSPADAERLLLEALKNQPEHLNAAMALASLRIKEGKPDEAEKVLREAVGKSSDRRLARLALGQFYAGQQLDDKAREQFDTIVKEDPTFGPAWLAIGMMHLKKNERAEAEVVYKRVSELDEEQYKPLYAQILAVNGKTEEAVAEYERLHKAEPDNRAFRSNLINAYLQTGSPDKAEALLNETIERRPRDSDARLQRAEVRRRAGNLEGAQSDLATVLEIRPNSHEAHYFLSKIHQARRDNRLQRQELDEAMRLDPSYLPARLEMVQSMLQSQNASSALDVLNEAPADQAQTMPILAAKVWAYVAMNRYDDAKKTLAAIPEAQRDTAEINLQEGVLRAVARDFAGAQTFLKRSLEQNPQDVRALNAYAGTFVAQKQVARALEVVRGQAEQFPDSPQMQLALAGWYERANYRQEARAAYRAAHEAGDTSGEAAIMTARLDAADGKYDEAVKTLEDLLEKSPRSVAAWRMLGLVNDAAGRGDQAIVAYRKAVEINPENFVALNNLAYLLSQRNERLEEALSFAQKAKELAPESADVDDTLGWIYYQRGVFATAAVHLRAAAAANPDNALTQYHLAMAQAKTGDASGARKSYDAAVRLDSNLPEAKEALAIIEAAK